MTEGESRSVEGRSSGDPLRCFVLGILLLLLAPAALIVLAIGGVGMVWCAVHRLVGGVPRPAEGGARRDRPTRVLATPHYGVGARSRSSLR